MSRRPVRAIVLVMRLWQSSVSLFVAVVLAACGSRTGLWVDVGAGPGILGDDAGILEVEASVPDDSPTEPLTDALPALDVTLPRDADTTGVCDGGQTFIYVVTEQSELLSFYPPTAAFTTIGTLNCPAAAPATPFSMAVDRSGIAYVVYNDGELFRVSTATGSCQRTKFMPGQRGFSDKFGMGFSRDNRGTAETLFVASGGGSPTLATIDPTGFALRIVGPLAPPIQSSELTGTGAGDLFAFYATNGSTPCDSTQQSNACADSAIGQVEKTTGRVTNQSVLFGNPQGRAWAFAFWGGSFYTFTDPGAGTIVSKFNPTDGSIVVVARRNDSIVGAGVSTCAPAQ